MVPGLSMRVGFAARQGPAPALKVYFRILDEESVELLYAEVDEDELFLEGF